MKRTLDEIDFKIVKALQENARLSNKELAAQVHLAPSSCLERARRLQEAGIFQGFHSRVDPASIGIGLKALVSAKLTKATREHLQAFQQELLDFEEVVALYHVTGASDFLIHVVVRDAEHLRRLVVEQLADRDGIERLETAVILNETQRQLPILNETPVAHAASLA